MFFRLRTFFSPNRNQNANPPPNTLIDQFDQKAVPKKRIVKTNKVISIFRHQKAGETVNTSGPAPVKKQKRLPPAYTHKQKSSAYASTASNAQPPSLPTQTLLENLKNFRALTKETQRRVGRGEVSSLEMFDTLKTSSNPKIKALLPLYQEEDIRMLPSDWLKINDNPRFLGKQL